MHSLHVFVASLLVGSLVAQSYTVSPAANATVQGTATNTFPLTNANGRYQQIHGDLRGTARVLQGMSLRRGNVTQAGATARSVNLSVLFAKSDLTKTSPTFAANYAAPPTIVFPAAQVNLPDWTMSGGNPEPWSIVVPFTTPFIDLGTTDIVWEWSLVNNTATTSYSADAYSGISADLIQATTTTVGTACTATGATAPMSFGPRCYTSRALGAYYYKGTALNGPLNAQSAILFGATNPNLSFPGLCTSVYTDALLVFPSTSSAAGSFSHPDILVPYNPAWIGVHLYAQAASADPGQVGFPLALSAGSDTVLPGIQPAGVAPIVRIFENTSATAAVGTVNYYSYGLIVRFTH